MVNPEKTIKQATTDAGNTYRKVEADNSKGYVFTKNGKFCSDKAFSAGYGEAVKGNGEVEADDGNYLPSAEVSVPTPDGRKQVTRATAGRMSDAASGRMGNVEVNGTLYSSAEIEAIWKHAPTDDRGKVVRY